MDNHNDLMKKENDEIKIYHSNEDDFSNYEEATFLPRFFAVIIDGFILAFITKVLSTIVAQFPSGASTNIIILVINIFIPTIYQIVFLTRDGQTLGKKALKIKVVNQDDNNQLSVGTVILREPVGKFISALVLGLGYFMVLFGKRAWHDNIANTKVIKVK